MDEDCDGFVGLQSASQSKKSITIDKILTESIFLINVKMVQLGDFSGSVYAHFPNSFIWDLGMIKSLMHLA